jgi:hypothetical protein
LPFIGWFSKCAGLAQHAKSASNRGACKRADAHVSVAARRA